uniref:Protein tweety homolog n=1 Tax=Globodera pallida TaxID=36090 RepID=A0A183CQ13_GLOPA
MGEQQRTNFADWLLKWAHRVPHFDFRFRRLQRETPFDVDPNGEYAQSLVILCALSLLLALLFLFATLLWWVSQCCVARRSGTPNRTSSKRVGRLSCALFLVSVLCFALMGACLYGNEHVNKSVRESAGALAHIANVFPSCDGEDSQAERITVANVPSDRSAHRTHFISALPEFQMSKTRNLVKRLFIGPKLACVERSRCHGQCLNSRCLA